MVLIDLKVSEQAKIGRVSLPPPVRERLRYLGVAEGRKVTLLKTVFKNTYILQAGSARLAVSKGIAKGIEICGN